MRQIELKPCPFCGYKEINTTIGDYDGLFDNVRMWCDRCGASVTSMTEEKAIRKWNRRADNEQAE